MTYIITYQNGAKVFEGVGTQQRKQTLKKLYEVATSEYRSPQQFDVEPLKDDTRVRLRVGDIRVLLEVDEEQRVLNVSKIGLRKNVYR